ncbi:MAG: rRNA maturation RNase YbeY [Deltaproteobacteria bacterium]|nr:rRNA maturation RNase YbeY [Deltaproteobacteria bacterium]
MTPQIDTTGVERGGPPAALRRALARRIRTAARAMGCSCAQIDGLTVLLADDARMRALKAEHMGIDEATDVLSFPAAEALPGEPPAPLGDVVLGVQAIARQAVTPGWAGWLDEATALAIHGVAHLLGHDHHGRTPARHMLACERRGSRAVRVACVRPYGGAGATP